ncbi:MAG: hypothetical protein RBU27_11710 [Bacteroidota bacterium]|jgi:hypothetical protein|nr:hypothetical protein [Bacteroidota bacterium]
MKRSIHALALLLLIMPMLCTAGASPRQGGPDPANPDTPPGDRNTTVASREDLTLPPDWTGLAGFRAPEGVMLRWSTASERHSAWFKIEARVSGSHAWRVVGMVAAAGQSSSPRFYAWLHNHPPRADVEYRLRQIDAFGEEHSTGVLHVAHSTAGPLRLSQHKANPGSTETLIAIQTGETTSGSLVILDEHGKTRQVVFQHLELHPGTYRFRIDTATLPEGKYTLRLITPDGDDASELLVCR